jgi:DNA-binding MarR family transcriptional regulator
MTSIEVVIKMMAALQTAFGKRFRKGDSLLLLRALTMANTQPGTTQAAIRKELGLSQPAASRLAGALKKRKWLESEPSTLDRRENMVKITQRGKQFLSEVNTKLILILRQFDAADRPSQTSRPKQQKQVSAAPGRMLWDETPNADNTALTAPRDTEPYQPEIDPGTKGE